MICSFFWGQVCLLSPGVLSAAIETVEMAGQMEASAKLRTEMGLETLRSDWNATDAL